MVSKAIAKDYSPSPFYLIDKVEGYEDGPDDFDQRFVCWTKSIDQLKILLIDIVDSFGEQLEILFKDSYLTESGEKDWYRYYGITTKLFLKEILEKHYTLVFGDGFSELCIRDESTYEYIALDSHGILFIYSNKEFFHNLLVSHGFKNVDTPTIDEVPHWHYRPKRTEINIPMFIEDLELEEV